MTARAFITGVSGTALTFDERSFLREAEPWGLIIFKRNVETPDQLRGLVASFRAAVGRADAPVLVDQEGGRVQRLGPPHWPSYPAGAEYGRLWDLDRASAVAAARLGARLVASDLLPLGIDVDCMPLGDVPTPDGDPVIGDRAYGADAQKVSAIAAAIADGLMDGGVLPVLKHLPGHGSGGFLRISAAFRPAPGDDRACRIFGLRPGRAGHHLGHNGTRGDSRFDRIRRCIDER